MEEIKFLVNEESFDSANWMANLDPFFYDLSLNHLTIPGTHDSFTYNLSKENEVCKPSLAPALQKLSNIGFVKNIIFNWSVTQSLSVIEQLELGIRYFDIRCAYENTYESVKAVHGLYINDIELYLQEIKYWLTNHLQEIVLLDFNHFYCFTEDQHYSFIQSINNIFGDIMIPVMDIDKITLNYLWKMKYQVIVFYHCGDFCNEKFWPGYYILSNWPNVNNCKDLIRFLKNNEEREKTFPFFRVLQGILTADAKIIVRNCRNDLKNAFSLKACQAILQYLRERKASVNICIIDYVETLNFAKVLISMNRVNVE